MSPFLKKTTRLWLTPPLIFTLLVLTAALARLWPLHVHALWFDEVFSIYYVQKGFGAIWGADWLLEPTPPLYYSLLALWTTAFGQAEPVLRFLSLVTSSIAAGFIYLSGRRLAGEGAGILAALLWSSLPLSIDYGLEIRAYALVFLEISVLTYLFICFIQDALLQDKKLPALRAKIAAFFSTGLILSYTHVTGILAFASYCSIGLAVLWINRRDLLAPFCIGGFAYCLALTPQIYASAQVMTGNAPTLAWLVTPGVMDVIALMRALMVGNMPWGDHSARLILAIWFCAGVLGLSRLRRKDGVLVATTLGVSFLGLIIFVAFSRFQAVLLNRTTLWMMIPALLFLSMGLARFPRLPFALLSIVLLSANAVASKTSLDIRADQRGDWRGIQEVVEHSDPNILIVTVDGELACEFHYVAPALYAQLRLADLQGKAHFQRTQRVDLFCNQPPMIEIDKMRDALTSGHDVWIIGRMPYYENGARMRQDVEQMRDVLTKEFVVKKRIENYAFIALLFGSRGR